MTSINIHKSLKKCLSKMIVSLLILSMRAMDRWIEASYHRSSVSSVHLINANRQEKNLTINNE